MVSRPEPVSIAIDPDNGPRVASSSLLTRFLIVNSNLRTVSTIFSRYLTRRSKAWHGGLRFARPINPIDALTSFMRQGRNAFCNMRILPVGSRNILIRR
jgi:hypothetical protein